MSISGKPLSFLKQSTYGCAVLKVELEGENGSQLPPVTVRVFGPNTDAVIDRDRELQVSDCLANW
jgi:hypothetical protein